ncbi:hypothetical protein HAX54_026919 [Datura stramonium]|uniref:Uncharacterized protein n=1 Tax=Datura stramonium TaxID=4076 RepID=A0ABS8S8A0_DATST|nr:hypothetical protein [Datura stramonium]
MADEQTRNLDAPQLRGIIEMLNDAAPLKEVESLKSTIRVSHGVTTEIPETEDGEFDYEFKAKVKENNNFAWGLILLMIFIPTLSFGIHRQLYNLHPSPSLSLLPIFSGDCRQPTLSPLLPADHYAVKTPSGGHHTPTIKTGAALLPSPSLPLFADHKNQGDFVGKINKGDFAEKINENQGDFVGKINKECEKFRVTLLEKSTKSRKFVHNIYVRLCFPKSLCYARLMVKGVRAHSTIHLNAGMEFELEDQPPMFGVGGLIAQRLEEQLFRWLRAAELTCDRAALLVAQDPKVVVSVLMKLAGGCPSLSDQLNVDAFLEQARSYDKASSSPVGWYIRNAQTRQLSHPLPVLRAREIDEWSRSQEYRSLLQHAIQEFKAFCKLLLVTHQMIFALVNHTAVGHLGG